ncbi:MAG: hypothetical protein ACERKD_00340 [Prolixibacteraceae bacterium]
MKGIHLTIGLLFVSSIVLCQNWEKEFERDGITVFTREVEGYSLKAFKGEMIMDTSINAIISILTDIARFPEWTYRTSSIELIKQENNQTFYRTTTDTPPIIKNREAYFCNQLFRNPATGEVIITIKTYPADEPVPDGFIRIEFSDGRWELTPIADEKTQIKFQVHADPGGFIPGWFANMVAVESPWITLKNLRNQLFNQNN